MRLLSIWPPAVYPPDLLRDIDTLSGPEWTELIVALEDIRAMFGEAADKATEEWARRYPRENYPDARAWCEAFGYVPPDDYFEVPA